MHISLVGINHTTAPVTIREKVAITGEQLDNSLSLLRQYLPHGIILSTCNRTEVYSVARSHSERAIIDFLEALVNATDEDLLPHLYIHHDEAVIKHLFNVTAGLDSMIIGEFEILCQVGQALAAAEKAGMVNLPLRQIFQSAIRSGRRVRDETGISRSALSVSSVAVDLAAGIVAGFPKGKMLVIGAGEAGRLVAKAARERGVSQIVVANRSREAALALASVLGGSAVTLDNLVDELSTAHIAVTCTGAPSWILDADMIAGVMKRRPESPLVIIDIGVPRNVDPSVAGVKQAFLFNIDDLVEIADRNRQQRQGEVQTARQIIDDEVARCTTWWQTLEVRPVVSELMKKAEDIRQRQLNQTLNKLHGLSEEERENLEAMTKAIVTKILKDPVAYLKAHPDNDEDYPEIITKLFHLKMDEPQ